MEGRVHGALRQIERVGAAAAKLLDYCVAMQRAVGQHRKKQQIEMPFDDFASHT